MKLYMIRHGETTLNRQKVYYGSTDCELTTQGEAQAESLRPFFSELSLDAVWISPLKRAVATAEISLGENTAPKKTDCRLMEAAFGEWEGKSWRELQGDPVFERWCEDWRHTRPPGGESFEDLSLRVKEFYETELLPFQGKSGLIVAHHAVLRQLTVCLLECDASVFWHFSFEQGAYSAFEMNHGFAVFTAHNVKP